MRTAEISIRERRRPRSASRLLHAKYRRIQATTAASSSNKKMGIARSVSTPMHGPGPENGPSVDAPRQFQGTHRVNAVTSPKRPATSPSDDQRNRRFSERTLVGGAATRGQLACWPKFCAPARRRGVAGGTSKLVCEERCLARFCSCSSARCQPGPRPRPLPRS
jgi:hypothetical protein